MNFDDLEKILEGILAGLKARKEIEPLRQKISELKTTNANLTSERDELNEKISNLQTRLEELTTEQKNSRRQLDDAREDFERQLSEQKTEFEQKISDANAELEREQKNSLQQLAAARENFELQLSEQKTEFERELSSACTELSDANEKRQAAERTTDFYRTTYAELENAYKIYLSLDEATRFDLAGIFGTGDNATGFFSGAVQESHLSQFWDYVSRHVEDSRLAELFDFCFEAFNRGFREPPYSRLVAESGHYFDDETMRRTSSSRQMGRVARVLLQGYRYSSGNVIRQSVVELA